MSKFPNELDAFQVPPGEEVVDGLFLLKEEEDVLDDDESLVTGER